jgi:hypothetical protein
MAGFWFLVSIVLLIMLLAGRKKNDSYAQGYWNGYRAFGDMVQDLINAGRADTESLRKLVEMGETGGMTVHQPMTNVDPEETFLTDTYDVTNQPDAWASTIAAPSSQVTELSPEQKAKRSLRNLNIILYTASFLLVAAGALFIASSSTPQTKLLTVIGIIVAFYAVGFVVHSKSERLRPAALAFLGTGLALIPFAGFALQQYTNLSPTQSWLITSVTGLVAYFVVAIRLQSQLIAYLTMAFVLSLVGSMTAAGVSAIVWQFVAIISVSLLANVVAHIKPNWLPKVFSEPVERSGQVVTPVVLVASLFVFDKLRITGYEIVFAVATLHYLVAWLQTRNIAHETVVRVLSYIVFALITWDVLGGNVATVAFTMFLLMTLQHVYSLWMVNRPGRASTERAWITVLFILQSLLFLFWLDYRLAPLFTTIALVVIGLTSLATAMRLRSVPVGLIGLGASLILPFVVARDLFSPSLPWWVLTIWLMVATIKGLLLYARWRHRSLALRYFMTTAYVAYLALAIIAAWFDGSSLVLMATYFTAAIITLTASYLARTPDSQVAVPLFIFLGMTSLGNVLNIIQPWYLLFVGGVTALILWAMVLAHGYLQQSRRQVIMLASGQVAFLIIVGVTLMADNSANILVTTLLLAAAFGSLMLRWVYKVKAPVLSTIFAYSYVVYFASAMMVALLIGSGWLATVTGLGMVLFMLASYVERLPWMQIVASALTIATLGIISSLIELPGQWFALFTFGGAAVLFYATSGLHFAYEQATRQLIMASTGQVTLFLIIFAGMSGHYIATLTSFIILLVWAVISLTIRWWCRDRSPAYSALFRLSYPVYYIGTLLLVMPLAAIWSVMAFTVGAIIFWVASYAERTPSIVILGNIFLTIALFNFWWWANLSGEWMILGVSWILATIFYFGYWMLKGLNDMWRSHALLWSTWIILAGAVVVEFFMPSKEIAVAAMIIAFAVTLAVEGSRSKRIGMIEAAVYVTTFGMQRIAEQLWPELNSVLYAHWWAIIIALIAMNRRTYTRTRLIVAMSFVTVFSGVYALTSGGNYQLLFLIEHLALLVAGALLSKSWAIWWGISASAIAILYFLRGYTFLLLGFLGLLLIAIVVWRLMRGNVATK